MDDIDSLFSKNKLEDLDFDKYLPENIYFGFAVGTDKQTKSDVLTSINNYVKDNFTTKRNAFFKLTKVVNHPVLPNGYFYEIQEKGFGVSFSEKVLFHFENDDNNAALLRINGQNVLIVRKLDALETNYTASEYLTEKQKEKFIKVNQEKFILSIKKPDMERVFKDKFAFLIMSSIFLLISLIVFIVIHTNNALHLSIKEPVKVSPVKVELPLYEITSIQSTYTERLISVELMSSVFIARKERLDEETDEVRPFEERLRVNNDAFREILYEQREQERQERMAEMQARMERDTAIIEPEREKEQGDADDTEKEQNNKK